MQIPSASWSNPAAHTQQSVSNHRSSQSTAADSSVQQLNPVEQSKKTEDRDANERYDGPMARQSSKQENDSSDESSSEESQDLASIILQLPADDGESSQLDISG